MSKVFTIAEGLQNLGALRTGGQGSVYKGKRTGTIYSAIKLIPTPIHTEDENDKNYRNFKNEVTKLQKVNENPSPNVVKIMSWGITDSGSFPYIEMEYIEGSDLYELLQPPHQKAFTIKELVKVADQLANAIAHCHQVGVKHGDIKSNNVKYNVHSGNYVLLDFGLAIMSEEQRRTSIRHAGAIEFMAPEQHEGKMLLQTDIYSYGIILYELLTGEVPFPLNGDGDTGRNAVMLGHMEGQIPEPIALRKLNLENSLSEEALHAELQIPTWLLAVVDKCLKKDPSERYANGMELADAITNGILLSAQQQVDAPLADQTKLAALALQARKENDRLEQELSSIKPLALKAGIKYNEASGNYEPNNFVHFPKRTFIGVAAVAALFLLLLSYNFFTRDKVVTATVPATTTVEPLFVTYNRQYFERLLKAREDSLMMAKIRLSEKVNVAEQVKKDADKKKKRKKFLGIF